MYVGYLNSPGSGNSPYAMAPGVATPPVPEATTQPPASPAAVVTPPIAANPAPPGAVAPPAAGAAAPGTPAHAPTYWSAGGSYFVHLADVGVEIQAGRLPLPPGGALGVKKFTWTDTAGQKAMHQASSQRYVRNAIVTGLGGVVSGVILAPLAPLLVMAGGALAAWNGYKAYEAWQAAQLNPAPAYVVSEEGRVRMAAGTYPPQFNYEAVDPNSLWNVVPDHPFAYRPSVPLDRAG